VSPVKLGSGAAECNAGESERQNYLQVKYPSVPVHIPYQLRRLSRHSIQPEG
jgi:hypothetical protein